ncbi:VOC family protein [Streptosporangium sp. NPDC004379]|uniref:VOC family protein n=1 Tax=Streptosporangium sp. NPDC004379 TaxID=3366189 RepID=UPI0036BA9821
MRTVYPLVRYRDPGEAADWLVRAFGFGVHEISEGDGGRVEHAELTAGTGLIMIGAGEPGGPGVYLAIDDPDAHHARSLSAGARITMELNDQPYGSREYACRDPEGNHWFFGTYRP